jgi:hypothetical protein
MAEGCTLNRLSAVEAECADLLLESAGDDVELRPPGAAPIQAKGIVGSESTQETPAPHAAGRSIRRVRTVDVLVHVLPDPPVNLIAVVDDCEYRMERWEGPLGGFVRLHLVRVESNERTRPGFRK